MTDRPVCLVSGVGPGTGRAVVRRFAREGFAVAMLARNAERLEEIEAETGNTHAFACDVSSEDEVVRAVGEVRERLGSPAVLVHNAVSATFGDFLKIRPERVEHNFRVNTMGLLYLARATAPAMIEAGAGGIFVTGNTSALRGRPAFSGFAPTKAAQRILAESMARSLGPRGIHVAYVLIDAVIDVAWARERYPDQPDEFFAKPDAIADVIWSTYHQDPSTWSFLVEIRPFAEPW